MSNIAQEAMNAKRTLLCIIWAGIPILSTAQHTNFNTQTNWALNKKEWLFGGGLTQFSGDLGGRNKLDDNHTLRDLNFPSTSWNGMTGYRYRFYPLFATTTKLNLGLIKGDDALKTDAYQNSRNLHFRSYFVELSQRVDVILLANEKMSCSRLRPRQKIRNRYHQFYAFAGIGLLYFNPEAQFNGSWTELQPLKTEGQGLNGGPKSYKRVTATFPLGIGFRKDISRMWRLGAEIEYKFTTTDYLDDVGGVYYDQNALESEFGEASAYLSNPSTQNSEWFTAGQARGEKGLDGFFTFNVIFVRNITYKDYSKLKRKKMDNTLEDRGFEKPQEP